MAYNTKHIMKRAWSIYREGMDGATSRDSFALALKAAWAEEKAKGTVIALTERRSVACLPSLAALGGLRRPTLYLSPEMRVAA